MCSCQDRSDPLHAKLSGEAIASALVRARRCGTSGCATPAATTGPSSDTPQRGGSRVSTSSRRPLRRAVERIRACRSRRSWSRTRTTSGATSSGGFTRRVSRSEVRAVRAGRGMERQRMALILDHINGVANDNRLENLRIVCPELRGDARNALRQQQSLDPHPAPCERCGETFYPDMPTAALLLRARCDPLARAGAAPQPETPQGRTPAVRATLAELAAIGYSAVGRKYGVSDNAVRKWVRWYERERSDGGLSVLATARTTHRYARPPWPTPSPSSSWPRARARAWIENCPRCSTPSAACRWSTGSSPPRARRAPSRVVVRHATWRRRRGALPDGIECAPSRPRARAPARRSSLRATTSTRRARQSWSSRATSR